MVTKQVDPSAAVSTIIVCYVNALNSDHSDEELLSTAGES